MHIIKKILLALLVLIVLLAAFLYSHLQTHAVVTTKEVIPDNEAEEIQKAADLSVNIVDALQTTYAARGVHAKGHACVKAQVTVNPDINQQLQYGVFAEPGKQYKAWIRFSNSGSNMAKSNDNAKDARGMAMKLLNVGENLNGGKTQEFIAHSSPAFFVTSVEDYNQFVKTKGNPKYFIQGYNPFKWRLRELWQLITAYAPPPVSPLWATYFSNTAYKLGSHNIKFRMQSCNAAPSNTVPSNEMPTSDDPDFLRHRLSAELRQEAACMQLSVQLQDATKQMPIEDATVLWKESNSPFLPVANITIIQQIFDTPEQQQFCENLSFSPWNALEAHRPIGALNRARQFVYEASSNYRHQLNGTTVPQQIDW